MNDGKPTSEAQAPALAAPSSDRATASEGSHGVDGRRRRLLRGAAGMAPVIITLRSGGLAASSCVGTKALGSTNTSGDFTIATGGPISAGGDRCVANYSTSGSCPSPADQILPKYSSSAVDGGTLSGTGGSGDPYKCSLISGSNTNVAIVSASVTSFM